MYINSYICSVNNAYIKSFTFDKFLKTLSMHQIEELMVKLRVQKAYEIDDYLAPGEAVDFSHFVELSTQPPMTFTEANEISSTNNVYAEVQCTYAYGKFTNSIWQHLKYVRVFPSEIDWKLYMALVDYQFPPRPDMVYFN